MPGTLDGLLAKGYRFVTVSQLLNMETAAPVVTTTKKAEPAGKAATAAPAETAPVAAPKIQ
jgi:hypothetical protein